MYLGSCPDMAADRSMPLVSWTPMSLRPIPPAPPSPQNIGASGVGYGLNYHKPALFLAVGLWLLITITRLTSYLRTVPPHTQVVKTLCSFVAVETSNEGDSVLTGPVANCHPSDCSVAWGVSVEVHCRYISLSSVGWEGYGRKESGVTGVYAWSMLRKPRKTAFI